jgi:hypothetical protein
LAEQEFSVIEKPDVELQDVDSVEPLRPSKDGNSSASSTGSSPPTGELEMKPNSSAVEQMIIASSKSSRQAMGNLRSGSQPFAPLQKEVKENVMVRKPSAAPASTASGTLDADSAAAAKAQQHPKSRYFSIFLRHEVFPSHALLRRFTIHDSSSSSDDDAPLPTPLRRTGGPGVPNKSSGSSSLRYRM